MDQAVAAALKAWGLPTHAEQQAALEKLERLSAQVEALSAQIARLEKKLAIQVTVKTRSKIKPTQRKEKL